MEAPLNATPGSAADLIAAVARGERLRFVFFWGHRDRKDGSVGPGCFSQWYAAPFDLDGARYPTAEHWMMAEKARLFGDEATRARILQAKSPGEAKALGRVVRGFVEERWASARFDVVVRGNRAKFGQHEALAAFLRATRERVLVEASPTDRVWGIGLAADDEGAADPRRWRGLNLLGFALMKVRDELGSEGG